MRNLDWFEVDQIRGHIKDGTVEHYQVVMKVGFRIDD
jgi:flavin-binding protein dodecin